MAVVIRLQGLRVTAGSEDIRKFFTGLKVPDGGVHIIGGELQEAFVIFASDEDARRAMSRSGGLIKNAPVTLLLSSKTEMQNVLERTTQNAELHPTRLPEDSVRHARRSMEAEMGRTPGGRSGYTPPIQHQQSENAESFFGVFLSGMPFSVTEGEIREFFGGLLIDEIVLMKNRIGQNNGKGFVNFSTREDALEALKRHKQYIGTRYIEVFTTTLHDWQRATGRIPIAVNTGENFERGRSPVRNQRNPHYHARSRSPVPQRHIAPSDEEYCVLLENLSFAVEKEDLKQLFHNAKLENDQILHLTDSNGKRTRSAFVLFKSLRDYCEALSHEKRQFSNRWVYTRPISRENMLILLESQSLAVESPGNPERSKEKPPSYPRDMYDSEKVCVFVRNLPFDVRKVEIIDFFHGFSVTEDKVSVLHDHKGAGVGQALVLFGSEAEAMEALVLNGQRFLGSEVTMKCISRSQMEQLAAEPPVIPEPLPREEEYSSRRSRSSEASYRPSEGFYPDSRNPKDGNSPGTYGQGPIRGEFEPRTVRPRSPRDRGNGVQGNFGSPVQRFDGPTCVQFVNLPFQIRSEEIYDFCYGYRIIPGSVSLQYDESGRPKGSATLVFESRQEAMTAIQELSGRPIGPRKVQLILV
ncbi:RNA binding motif protein 12Bb [Odontesthes bonariensis]|uniref:RNA binding motif protein 12Bb n=1 Tax=Odontesthes bonariensis TaxID=219752 RepID=UPI003F5845FC